MLTTFRNKKYSVRRAAVLAAGIAAMLAIAGCHKKAKVAPPPPPPAATAPAPTATITATPNSINPGQSAVLTWSSTDANSASIDNGIGSVPTAGTKTVSPTETTTYTLTVTGDGGNATASATVTVNQPQAASAPTESNITEAEFEENVKPIFFPFNKYNITPDSQTTIANDATYLNAHPNLNVVVGGYCDDRGSVEYNLALGENRANAAKQALVSQGVSANRLRTVSYGKEKQFCTEQTPSCWQSNRRAMFTLDQ